MTLRRPVEWAITLDDGDESEALRAAQARIAQVGSQDPDRRQWQLGNEARRFMAEFALARMLGLEPDGGTVGDEHPVGGLYHVRARPRTMNFPSIPIREEEVRRGKRPYVLVVGEGRVWRALGWVYAGDATKSGMLNHRTGIWEVRSFRSCDFLPGLPPIDVEKFRMPDGTLNVFRVMACLGNQHLERVTPAPPGSPPGPWAQCQLCGRWMRPTSPDGATKVDNSAT